MDTLCYACAVRMSTLWRSPPPAPYNDPLRKQRLAHPIYHILYPLDDTANHDEPSSVNQLCVACLGLYQFIDTLHAPRIAASVRQAPYKDSSRISVNVNVCRGFTFLWLHHALKYMSHMPAAGTATTAGAEAGADGASKLCSSSEASAASLIAGVKMKVVPEEFSSFKEMYVSDLRARVLQFLIITHDELLAKSPGQRPVGFEAYHQLLSGDESVVDRKRPREGEDVEIGQSSTAAARFAIACPQCFTYDAVAQNGVVVDVEIRHRLTSVLVDGRTCVPSQYCNNKSSGNTITFGVILEHVSPFLGSDAAKKLRDEPQQQQGLTNHFSLATVVTKVYHTNIYILGRYRKMLRGLSQSPWFAEGGRVGSFSLQEVIAEPIVPLFFPDGVPCSILPTNVAKRVAQIEEGRDTAQGPQARKCHGRLAGGLASPWQEQDPFETALEQVFAYGRYKFHSAGREDVDVRMLGSGRPFVLEVIDPHRQTFGPADLAAMDESVNKAHDGAVEIEDLAFTVADVTVTLARHSESKTKH